MEVYKLPIEFAFVVFPIIAFILTIPFLIHQYRKYGAIPLLKSVCFYSLILYLICAYFLVMLPLPSIEAVSKMTGPKTQLKLFQFIEDIILTTNYKIDSFQTLIKLLKQPTMYIVGFNFLLTMPFGIYLRYYFKQNWFKTIVYTFLLSLFFELTQLSGLYGIYPRPYRLFDVDDLLINTTGGLFGYLITPLFTLFLPTRDELEEKSYKKGKKVTLLRRAISFIIDIFFLSILCLALKIFTYGNVLSKYSTIISLVIYYLLIPLFTEGQTMGKKIVKLKLSGFFGKVRWYQILFRNIILVFFTIFPFSWTNLIKAYDNIENIKIIVISYQMINIIYYIYTLGDNEHLFLYERLTKTKNISIIEDTYNKNNKEKNKDSENTKNNIDSDKKEKSKKETIDLKKQ